MKESVFPKDFLWGAATSSHQIEGGLENNWTKWEPTNAQGSTGKVREHIGEDLQQMARDKDCYISNSKYSCDSFNNWEKDIQAIKEMGLKAYRFSIEWSRIEPLEGEFSEDGLEYYKNLIKGLKDNNIEPIVTLWHWTIPLWLDEKGGIMSKEFLKYWKRFVEYVVEGIGKDIKYWITINEPGVVGSMSYLAGGWPPCKKNVFLWSKYYLFTFPKSHKIAYRIIKKRNSQAMVSFAHQGLNFEGYKGRFINNILANIANYFTNFLPPDLVRKELDFIALNFYFNGLVSITGLKNTNDVVTDLGWWYQPEKLEDMVRKMYKRYKLPIIITENGLADYKDFLRKDWLDKSIKALENCLEDGVEVFGYLHWSLLDNFEWADGFWPQFGLVGIDYDTKERKVKESGYYYSKIIEKNGII